MDASEVAALCAGGEAERTDERQPEAAAAPDAVRREEGGRGASAERGGRVLWTCLGRDLDMTVRGEEERDHLAMRSTRPRLRSDSSKAPLAAAAAAWQTTTKSRRLGAAAMAVVAAAAPALKLCGASDKARAAAADERARLSLSARADEGVARRWRTDSEASPSPRTAAPSRATAMRRAAAATAASTLRSLEAAAGRSACSTSTAVPEGRARASSGRKTSCKKQRAGRSGETDARTSSGVHDQRRPRRCTTQRMLASPFIGQRMCRNQKKSDRIKNKQIKNKKRVTGAQRPARPDPGSPLSRPLPAELLKRDRLPPRKEQAQPRARSWMPVRTSWSSITEVGTARGFFLSPPPPPQPEPLSAVIARLLEEWGVASSDDASSSDDFCDWRVGSRAAAPKGGGDSTQAGDSTLMPVIVPQTQEPTDEWWGWSVSYCSIQ